MFSSPSEKFEIKVVPVKNKQKQIDNVVTVPLSPQLSVSQTPRTRYGSESSPSRSYLNLISFSNENHPIGIDSKLD